MKTDRVPEIHRAHDFTRHRSEDRAEKTLFWLQDVATASSRKKHYKKILQTE
jgi:hypothetical protein